MKLPSFLCLFLLLLCPLLAARPTDPFSSDPTQQPSSSSAKRLTVGVCAMDGKTNAKPMKSLLTRLSDEYHISIFGDENILHKSVQEWPRCDFLISFFSKGFPLQKAIDYVNLRKPYCVNDLNMQHILLDRRCVLKALDAAKVPTPRRLVVNRDAPNGDLVEAPFTNTQVEELDVDTLVIDGQIMKKPFVEKPADSENHDVNIYYSSDKGGGVRSLFRKVGNEASRLDLEKSTVRRDGSYIYEEFLDLGDNAVDVKVYAVGPDYVYAETRKSPVLDGVVERDAQGKEIRCVTELSEEELGMARKIRETFGQNVCGFDLIRANGKSYVIDVNGWSFVKGSEEYYDNAARALKQLFASKRRKNSFWRRCVKGIFGKLGGCM